MITRLNPFPTLGKLGKLHDLRVAIIVWHEQHVIECPQTALKATASGFVRKLRFWVHWEVLSL